MAVQGEAYIHKMFHAMKKIPQYRSVLSTLLKYEIHLLLQQLSDAGEESILITVGIQDGSLCMLGSHGGDTFMNSTSAVRTTINKLQEDFMQFCCTRCFVERDDSSVSLNLVSESPEQSISPAVSTVSVSMPQEQSDGYHHISKEAEHHRGNHSLSGNQSDSSIDDNVSALVQNIMKCAKEKETQSMLQEMQKRRGHSRRGSHSSNKPSSSTSETVKSRLRTCLNKNFDEAEKNVEETVSQLVQNIMKESEEKEKQSMRQSWYNYRRRRRWSPWQRQSECNPENNSSSGGVNYKPRRGRKRKTIAECFPDLTQIKQQKLVEGFGNSSSNQSVLIKEEPVVDYTEYGCVNTKEENDYPNILEVDDQVLVVNAGADMIAIGENQDDKCGGIAACAKVKMTGKEVNKYEEEETREGSEEDKVAVKIKEEEDEEVELPFVEEYYKNLGEVNGSDLWTNQESGDTKETEELKLLMRRFGKSNLVHNGFSYIRDKAGRNNTVYWKCGRYGCKGRVIQRGREKIRTQDHNHSPVLQFEDSAAAVEEVASE